MKILLRFSLILVAASLCAVAADDTTPRGVIWLVEYTVAADGMPVDIRVVVTADPSRDSEIVATVAKNWKSPLQLVGQKRRDPFLFVQQKTEGVRVTVELTADSSGHAHDVRVVESVDHSTDAAVISAVSRWIFPKDYAGQRWKQQFYYVENP